MARILELISTILNFPEGEQLALRKRYRELHSRLNFYFITTISSLRFNIYRIFDARVAPDYRNSPILLSLWSYVTGK